jgi:hypothetical protein
MKSIKNEIETYKYGVSNFTGINATSIILDIVKRELLFDINEPIWIVKGSVIVQVRSHYYND